MKNSQYFTLSIMLLLNMSIQKLIAQPQFIIEDKVVFVTSGIIEDTIVFANKANQAQPVIQNNKVAYSKSTQSGKSSGIIEDTIVFANASAKSSGSPMLKLDSIHKKLTALKKGSYEKTNMFNWYNPHPTISNQIEGYNIVILVPNSNKILAEFRFARQKTNVWVDEKFKNSANPADIKTVIYSEQNRKATVETFGGYKFTVSIGAKSGNIVIGNPKVLSNDIRMLPNYEIRIYKTAKLF